MNLDKEKLLTESKNFCMAPWIHMHLFPAGTTYPCCLADSDLPVRKRYQEHLSYLDQFKNIDSVKQDFRNILQYLETDRTKEIPIWRFSTLRLDNLRKESVFEVFPELEGLRG